MKSIGYSQRAGFILFVLSFFLALTADAQVTTKVGGGVGVISALSDMNGSTIDYYSGTKLGFNSGFNIHGRGKIGVAGFTLVGGIDYSTLESSGNSEPGQGNVEITQNIFTLKAGPEFHVSIPAFPITPYFGVNIAINNFSGETRFQGVSKIPTATYTIESTNRIGAGITIGAEVSIGPLMSLDFTTAYNFMNISGSEWKDVNPTSDQRLDSYLSLNDAKDPLYSAGDDKHFVANDRKINSMLFTVSFLIGL